MCAPVELGIGAGPAPEPEARLRSRIIFTNKKTAERHIPTAPTRTYPQRLRLRPVALRLPNFHFKKFMDTQVQGTGLGVLPKPGTFALVRNSQNTICAAQLLLAAQLVTITGIRTEWVP